MNKNETKALRFLAEEVDNVFIKQKGRKQVYESILNRKVTPEDLELANADVTIEEGKEYTMKIPMYHEVNHFRRMKKAYKANGANGVYLYLKRQGVLLEKKLISNLFIV